MSKALRTFFLAGLTLFSLSSLQAQFTPGNLALLQTNGTTNNSTCSIIEIDRATAGQSPVSTFLINGTTGTGALRFSASAGTTGYLANSNDGTLLCFAGHNTTTTTGNINTVTARGVGTLDASQTFTLATTYISVSGQQARCATSIDNATWFIGDQNGIYSNGTSSPDPSGNFRGTKAFGGTVYVGQTSNIQASTLSAATGGQINGLPGLNTNGNFVDFYLVSSNGLAYDILYITSSGATPTIDKYSLVGGTWVSNGSYTTSFGGFGITAKRVGAGAELYVSTGNGSTAANSVVKCVDRAGYNTNIDINTPDNITLYTAPAGTIIKGLAFAPVAATPGTMRITEYMYSGANGEFVEFTNVGGTSVDMTGWSYSDNSEHPGHVNLSAFGIVHPGESVILTETDADAFRADWNLCSGTKVIGGNGTDNLGRADEINLYDASSTLIDRLTFDDQTIAHSIRTQNISGWVSAAGLGMNDATAYTASAIGDSVGSVRSTGGDIGSPGKSTRASVVYTPCTGPVAGAPTIVIDVANTSDFLDGGAATSPASPFAVSSVVNDPTDQLKANGIVFTIGDDATPVNDLVVTVTSSNTTVVPNANLVLTGTGASRNLTITPAAAGYSNITVTVNDGTLTNSYVLNYAASSPSPAGSVWSTGISDASAAIALDSTYMVIGDDEHNLLYVVNRDTSGLPVKTFDFNANNLLGLTDGSPGNWKELDLEATTISPSDSAKSYWLGSMSNSSSFNDKPNRNRIMAIRITGTGTATTFANAGFYSGLRQQLIAWGDANGYDFTASAAEGVDPKTVNGFNAEGMVFGPDNTTLYIGFRAPLVPTATRTRAVIAPILNFETWFNGGTPSGAPTIGAPIELDLGLRGIRDLVRLPNGNYVIVAGSYDGTARPAIYTWTGKVTDAPVFQPSFDLTGQNAEAALSVNVAGQPAFDRLQVISDDGDHVYYGDGVAAKDLGQNDLKKFGSLVTVSTLGNVLPVDYEYFTAQRKGADVQLNWKTGIADNVASFDVLRSANGADYASIRTLPGFPNQSVYAFTDLDAPATRLYYRIRSRELSGELTYSTIRVIEATGVNTASVKVYPNPVTNGVFSVTTSQAGAKTVSIYNSAGMLYRQVAFAGTAKDISTAGWPKGYYLLRIVMADGSTATEKLIIQ